MKAVEQPPVSGNQARYQSVVARLAAGEEIDFVEICETLAAIDKSADDLARDIAKRKRDDELTK